MKTKVIKAVLAAVGVCALAVAIGTVGAIDSGAVGLMQGAVRALVGLGVVGACVRIEEVL